MESSNNSNLISVFQLNTLANVYATKDSFPYVSNTSLDWESRKVLFDKMFLKEENNHDIYCLEEVDEINYFKYTFKNNKINYDNIHYDKKYIVNETKIGAKAGLSMFYNIDKLKLLIDERLDFPDNTGSNGKFCICAVFKHKETGINFLVIQVHLKAKVEFEETRLMQVMHIQKTIPDLIDKWNKKLNYQLDKIENINGIIVAGDFNAQPNEKSINLMNEKNFFINNNIIALNSVFDTDKNSNDFIDFTSLKLRDKLVVYIIDYIFYSDLFKVISKRRGLKSYSRDDLIKMNGLPNEFYPSDHLFLTAIFEIKN